jgi:monoamine oxidase
LSAPIKPGAWPLSKKAEKSFETFTKDFLKNNSYTKWQENLDRYDWWTVLRNTGFSTDDLLRRDLIDGTDFGESIRHVGGYSAAAEYLDPDTSNKYDEMDLRIEGGNTRLVNSLARAVGLQHIHTCIEVQRVAEKKGVIAVTARDNRADEFESPPPQVAEQIFTADACICTVPARVLRSIVFDPPLPPDKVDAANRLQYCRIMKTVMLFGDRFWTKGDASVRFSCFTDVTSDFLFDATLGQPGDLGILCSYAIGDKADDLAARGTEALRTVLEQDLTAIFPGACTKILAIERYAWQGDKYTQGAYALYRPGQWFRLRQPLTDGLYPDKKMGYPHGKVLFAGEHIADEQGFMDGAVDTGQDAARLL